MASDRTQVVAAQPGSPGAIAQAVASLGDAGGVVLLEPGEHVVDRTIALPDGVTLIGAGPERTTVTLAPRSSCHVFTNADHAKGNRSIELRGFRLEGNLRDQPKPPDLQGITFACGGYFKRVRDLVVDTITAHGIRQTAFHFNHCNHVRIVGLQADELGWSGVSTSGTDDIVLRRVVVTRSGLDVRHSGIHLDGGTGAYVEAVVDTSTGNGIMLDSKFSPMADVVVHGVARGCMRGLSLSGGHEHALANASISGDYSDNRECGVLVSNASNVFLLDATIAGNGDAGVVVQGKGGSPHCVIARSTISGSPELVIEKDGNRLAYVTESTWLPIQGSAPPLQDRSSSSGPAEPTGRVAKASTQLPRRVARKAARVVSAVGGRTAAPAPPATAPKETAHARPANDVPDDDAFEGTCNVCGEHQVFVRRNASLREGYRCTACKASLRYRGQADALLRTYARNGATTIAALAREPEFASLAIWEPGVLGPLREHLTPLPGYVMSDFWPDVEPGSSRDGVRCEDLMALTFPDGSFDLVITSDIFEHVRRPFEGFAEVHRVLRQGGRHIFSIPVQEPWRAATLARVDTSGPEDVMLLEPRYHLGPGNSQHLVYNDFGRDLVDGLEGAGFATDVIRFESPSAEAARLLTFRCTKR